MEEEAQDEIVQQTKEYGSCKASETAEPDNTAKCDVTKQTPSYTEDFSLVKLLLSWRCVIMVLLHFAMSMSVLPIFVVPFAIVCSVEPRDNETDDVDSAVNNTGIQKVCMSVPKYLTSSMTISNLAFVVYNLKKNTS